MNTTIIDTYISYGNRVKGFVCIYISQQIFKVY